MSDGASSSDHGYNPGRKTEAQRRRDAYWAKKAAEKSTQQQPKKQSLEQYLSERGLSNPISDYSLDKMKTTRETERQRRKRESESLKAARDYQIRRRDAINEYNSLVKAGKIAKPSKIDELRAAANGHPDNPSVQAARRLLKKRGLSW